MGGSPSRCVNARLALGSGDEISAEKQSRKKLDQINEKLDGSQGWLLEFPCSPRIKNLIGWGGVSVLLDCRLPSAVETGQIAGM